MSVLKIYLTKSPKSDKKFRIQYTQNGKGVKVDFGAAGASDFTKHKDPTRMARYVGRHLGKNGYNKLPKNVRDLIELNKKGKLTTSQKKEIIDTMLTVKFSPKENWKRSGIHKAGFWSRWLTWSEPSLQKAIRLINRKFKVKVIRKSSSHKFKMVPDNVVNKELYTKVKAEVKSKFKSWPSAYASGQVVRTYKSRGGKYRGSKKKSGGLSRWFDEKWINVCKLPKKVACGRPKSTNMATWKKKYPYCRPSVKVTKGTPRIASSLTKRQIKSRCRRKKANPKKRILK
jgi:hypothetical protein